MAHFSRYPGLDIPVFDRQPTVPPSSVFRGPRLASIITTARNNGQKRILREVRLYKGSADTPLISTLRAAEEIFEQIASSCGGVVLGHEYGLMPLSRTEQARKKISSSKRNFSNTFPCIPEGHKLVAAVDIMRNPTNIPRFSKQAAEIRDTIHATQCSLELRPEKMPPYIWLDAGVKQFSRAETNNPHQLVLHDIEPIIAKPSPTFKYACDGCLGFI